MGCDNMENQVLIGRGISKLSNQIHRNIAISCSSTNMSGTQGRVLHFILSNNGDVFQKDIESEFNLRPSTATGILKLMEKNGVIRRESTPYDARLKRIVITEKGAGLKDQIAKDVVRRNTDAWNFSRRFKCFSKGIKSNVKKFRGRSFILDIF